MATKTAQKQARNVLNVAKYLSFYHCYLIFYDVKIGATAYLSLMLPLTNISIRDNWAIISGWVYVLGIG